MSTLFDAHTHIHFPAYDTDRDAVIQRARQVGVKMIAVGTTVATSRSAIALAEQYPDDIWATVGFHPTEINSVILSESEGSSHQRDSSPSAQNDAILRKLAAHPKVVAIGECGLDYYRLDNSTVIARSEATKQSQKEVFLGHMAIAQEAGKPLMIHCRPSKGTDDAYEDLVREFSIFNFQFPKVMHFFVGSLPITKKLLEAGCSFTFGGVITFVRDYDEVIKFLPLENILLETDAPYVTPVPYRGQRNEPAFVVEVAKKMAEIKNVSLEEVVAQTTKNIQRVFKIELKNNR